MTEHPNPEVFEHWEEKVKAWREVQEVLDWIKSDRDLFDSLMKIHRQEVTPEEGIAMHEAALARDWGW